ncbi:efflux RND transporter periplasmic adaptor subunit [Azohydromonas lata]|uniref:efflux RND transporter periplasmic adaptor subunit n=1 Tax=Azohydromonas lata TaxID=45677 RepID=UPI00082A361C|nr:efflux RND transporter periplasmic adaptor subunit [Azohydromonas lata]
MKTPKTPAGRKQWAAVAALVAAGLLGSAAILHTPAATPAAGHGDEHGAGHADHDEHNDHGEHEAGKPDAAGQDHEDEHKDEHEDRHGHGNQAQEKPAGQAGSAGGAAAAAAGQPAGRLAMTAEQVQAAGIAVEKAAAAPIRTTLQLPGQIRFNEDRTAHVVPRVAGVVDSVSADLGQAVRRGQVLAVISSAAVSELRSELQAAQRRQALARTTFEREQRLWQEKISPQQDVLQAEQALREAEIALANAHQKLQALGAGTGGGGGGALNRFELRAPFDGTIVEKHLALGEAVKEDASVFTLSDLRSVWAEVDVAAQDLRHVRVGARVTVRSSAFDEAATGTVAYVGSLLGELTRTAKARVSLANPQGAWRPGLFVTVEVVTGEAGAPVTVAAAAVQQLGDKPVVFEQVAGGFVPRPVELGRSDGQRVEVLRGLPAGAPYAAAGSFVLKSEAGKGSATHTH